MKTLKLEQDFNLKHTLECGQFFRWEKIEDWYYLVCFDTLTKVKQKGNNLYSITKPQRDSEFINHIFRLDDDLDSIVGTIIKDAMMVEAVEKFKGLRIMRQNPLECLISFICSANSSIPNIKIKLTTLAELYGDYIGMDGYSFFTFPKLEALVSADVDELKDHKIGYHSKFIKETARIMDLNSIDLNALKDQGYENVKRDLLNTFGGSGVGEKVADCVCLFSLEKLEAFPIDVWIERIMKEYYFGGEKVSKEGISKFAREYFGSYAGYAQEYLYHYKRNLNSNSD